MAERLVIWLLENGEQASILLWVLATSVILGLALYKEWLVLGKPYAELKKECDTKTKALEGVNEALTEQRILNAKAAAAVEAMQDKASELELRLARAEGDNRQWQSSRGQRERPPS